jgi:ABC-type multidrug transport system permease subunit
MSCFVLGRECRLTKNIYPRIAQGTGNIIGRTCHQIHKIIFHLNPFSKHPVTSYFTGLVCSVVLFVICYSVGMFRQTQLYNLLVSLFVYLATCFGHLFGHLQAILEGVYFLFTLLHLYTATRPVISDLLFVFYG